MVRRLLTADTCGQGLGAIGSVEDGVWRALCGLWVWRPTHH